MRLTGSLTIFALNIFLLINLVQSDSLTTSTDSLITRPVVVEVVDTATQQEKSEQIAAPVAKPEQTLPIVSRPIQKTLVRQVIETSEVIVDSVTIIDSATIVVPIEYKPFVPYSTLNSKDSSIVRLSANTLNNFQSTTSIQAISSRYRNKKRVFEKEWVLGISIFIIVLIIIVRIYSQKALSQIINSLVNLQMADKLLREKNVMVRRVFFLLNLNYLIVISLYFYQVVKRKNLDFSINNEFTLFLFILIVLIGLIVLRLAFARFIAFVFDAVPVFKEYIHNTFIINKNFGMYMFPVLVSIVYVGTKIGDYLFILATIMLIVSILFRYLKGIQIILKHNIFLFYSILYLCTLEILPILIGIKFVLER